MSLVNSTWVHVDAILELMARAYVVNPWSHSSAAHRDLPCLHRALCVACKSFHNLGSAAFSGMIQYVTSLGIGQDHFHFKACYVQDPLTGMLFSQVFM